MLYEVYMENAAGDNQSAIIRKNGRLSVRYAKRLLAHEIERGYHIEWISYPADVDEKDGGIFCIRDGRLEREN